MSFFDPPSTLKKDTAGTSSLSGSVRPSKNTASTGSFFGSSSPSENIFSSLRKETDRGGFFGVNCSAEHMERLRRENGRVVYQCRDALKQVAGDSIDKDVAMLEEVLQLWAYYLSCGYSICSNTRARLDRLKMQIDKVVI